MPAAGSGDLALAADLCTSGWWCAQVRFHRFDDVCEQVLEAVKNDPSFREGHQAIQEAVLSQLGGWYMANHGADLDAKVSTTGRLSSIMSSWSARRSGRGTGHADLTCLGAAVLWQVGDQQTVLMAYFNVCSKRVLDNVCMVIENKLLQVGGRASLGLDLDWLRAWLRLSPCLWVAGGARPGHDGAGQHRAVPERGQSRQRRA